MPVDRIDKLTKVVTFRMPLGMWNAIERIANDADKPATRVIREALRKHIELKGKGPRSLRGGR